MEDSLKGEQCHHTWSSAHLRFVGFFSELFNIFSLTPESPKFLVQKRRKDAAVRAISYINKWKKVENRMTEEQVLSPFYSTHLII